MVKNVAGTDYPPPAEPDGKVVDELQKLRYQAFLEVWQKRLAADDAAAASRNALLDTRRDKQSEVEANLRSAVHAAYLEVAKESIGRSLNRANYVSAGAGAIATSYAAMLALVYSGSKDATPMPAIGIMPAVYLGLALALSVFYASYLSKAKRSGHYLPAVSSPNLQERRMATFVNWVSDSIHRRSWSLRIAVVALGLGVLSMPAPFLALTFFQTAASVWVPGLILGFAVVMEIIRWWREKRRNTDPEDGGQTELPLLKGPADV